MSHAAPANRLPFCRFLTCLLLSVAVDTLVAPRAGFAQPQATVSTSVAAGGQTTAIVTTTGAAPSFHPGRVLVRFRNGSPHQFLPGSGPTRPFPGNANVYVANNPPGLSVAESVRRYRQNPNILYAEPDFVVQAILNPNDLMWSQQYDMMKISAPAAWDAQIAAAGGNLAAAGDAGDIVVAVIDTGIDFTRPDLAPNAWIGPAGEHGYIFNNGTETTSYDNADDFGHGTHVAGTIGAVGNDGGGMAGINWKVQLLSLKFLNSSGSGYISDAVLAFNKALYLKQHGYNVRVTSNSWGGGGYSQTLKDAMAAGEAAGIIDVCAAGNSNTSAGMYPAAYDNRGIVSVLATDSNDVGASFTNYGLAIVDIAAPGVNTLSTVPTGTCTLCDSSGFKLLSGTSMATPHVSGVLAAMVHKNPALTAFQARDVVLDPGSYDTLTDAKARTTSTGGRLNFAKAMANPLLFNISTLNNFPTLSVGPNVFATAGTLVNLTATAADADNDPLRMSWTKSVDTGSQWLFGWTLNTIFPNPSGNPTSFIAPATARAASPSYDATVADGRGGSASATQFVTVSAAPSPGLPPSGTLTVTPATALNLGDTAYVSFPATDPEGGPVSFDLWAAGMNGSSGWCCWAPGSVGLTFNSSGVYRISTVAMDRELNESTRPSVVVRVRDSLGNVPTGEPPTAAAVLDKVSGTVPLTVNVDMSGSLDTDGFIQWFFIGCGGGGFTAGTQTSKGSCTYTVPGTYWLLLQVQDDSGRMDLVSRYVVATPPAGGPDTTPPSVSITSPANNYSFTIGANVPVTADASDSSGIAKVEFYRDGGVLIGTATSSPYTINWNTTGLAASSHTLYAVATDASPAANQKTSASISVTANTPPPPKPPSAVVSVSPVSNGTVARKASETVSATVTPGTNPMAGGRVDFYLNGALLCSDSTSPYSCQWNVPAAAGKTYKLQATPVDSQGLAGTSNIVSVTAK